MSTFERPDYAWRETYFVLFKSAQRPSLERVRAALSDLGEHFELSNSIADEEGNLAFMTLIAPDDFSALDVSYLEGDEVRDQCQEWADEWDKQMETAEDHERLKFMQACDARFDLLHFEYVGEQSEESDDLLDPGALLIVLNALARLTDGIGIDPQAGEFY